MGAFQNVAQNEYPIYGLSERSEESTQIFRRRLLAVGMTLATIIDTPSLKI